jgi:hypothetical protein
LASEWRVIEIDPLEIGLWRAYTGSGRRLLLEIVLRVWNLGGSRNFTPRGSSQIISDAGFTRRRLGCVGDLEPARNGCRLYLEPARIMMTYEPRYERFEVLGSDGSRLGVEFIRSGFLAQGDRPELFFFRVNGEETVVGISGASLARFEHGRRRLSREQKIDVAGRWLKRQMEAGTPLNSGSLYIRDDELANLANELDFTE